MRALLALLPLCAALAASAQDCVPAFYNAEPRDATWYYGVGKGADASLARKDALENLHLKVSGGQPGVPMDVLAGWEQDDHGECRGVHYVIDRIEKDRARANLARILDRSAKPRTAEAAPAPAAVTVNNSISLPAPPPARDDGLKYFALAAAFAFGVSALALLRRHHGPAHAGPLPSVPVDAEPRPRPAPSRDPALKERFAAVARQPQAEAMSEIARTGVLAYLKAHRGEGTCKSVAGAEAVVREGVKEMAYRYDGLELGWTVSSEPWAFYAIRVDGQSAMGFAFNLYASVMPGYVDCEILYAAGLPVENGYRREMEEGLHQGLPWAVQAAAARLGAARSREDAG